MEMYELILPCYLAEMKTRTAVMTRSFYALISLSQSSHHLCEFVVCEVVFKNKERKTHTKTQNVSTTGTSSALLPVSEIITLTLLIPLVLKL